MASAELEPSQVQDLGDVVPKLLEIKAQSKSPIRFHVRIEMGDGESLPAEESVKDANRVLNEVKDGFQLRQKAGECYY